MASTIPHFAPPEATGRSLAEQHRAWVRVDGYRELRGQLVRLQRLFRQVDRRLATTATPDQPLARPVEWLLDNAYVIGDAVRQVRAHLPHRFYRELPKVTTSPGRLAARAHAIARAVVAEAGGLVDLERLRRVLDGYQEEQFLQIGELWALPALLRLTLLEDLGGFAAVVAGLPNAASSLAPEELETQIGNRIRSLQQLDTTNWRGFVESVSAVERVLRTDPGGVYGRMDFETRDGYRKAVEELADWSGLSEPEVARAALRLAASAPPREPRKGHLGAWLIDRAARRQLEHELGCRVPLGRRIRRGLGRWALVWYLGAIGTVTVGLAVTVAAVGPAPWAWAIVLALLPVSAVAVGLVDWLVTHLIPPVTLPKLASRHGLPADCPTVVVIPALLTRPDEVDRLLAQVEVNIQGNHDPQLSYVLLTDFADASARSVPEDAGLVARAAAGVRRLNREYGGPLGTSFHLLHRERTWNPAEGCWMGWERKRGKVTEFNQLLLGKGSGQLQVVAGAASRFRNARFVITLDADTALPPGTAGRLVGTMAHPLNQPEWDAEGRVTAGYTVLQPRIEVEPSAGEDTLFGRVFQGDTTLDLYSRAVSDVYQDLFDEGTFVGKGIYHVAGFERSLAGRVPENALLSHDLFEGAHGRAGLVSDIMLLEEYPANVLAYFRRILRWTRGDWQLLPWLLGPVPAAGGGLVPNRLSVLNRWKMFDNLRRSLLPPALILLMVAGWVGFPAAAGLWTGVALVALGTPILLGALSWVYDLVRGPSRRATTAVALERLRGDAARWALQVTFLAYEAGLRLEAIGRTLLRVIVTRKGLLEWTSAAHTAVAVRGAKPGVYWWLMVVSPLAAVAVTLLMASVGSEALAVAGPILLLWAMVPVAAWAVSRPPRPKEHLAPHERAAVRRIARRTWLFFENYLGPDQHWLVPDHVQDEPGMGAVHRTSPTNLGMALVAAVSAFDLGYLDRARLVATLSNALEGMARLERYRGHLFNWYDTQTPMAIEPRYVSTVDSGNLAAALIVVQQACLDAVHQPLLGSHQLAGLADTAGALREAVSLLVPDPGGQFEDAINRLDHLAWTAGASRGSPAARHRHLSDLLTERLPAIEAAVAAGFEAGTTHLDPEAMSAGLVWIAELRRHVEQQRDMLMKLLPWAGQLARPPAAYRQSDGPAGELERWTALESLLARSPSMTGLKGFGEAVRVQLDALERSLDDGALSAALQEEARSWNRELRAALETGEEHANKLLLEFSETASLAEELFRGMDWRFLFDRSHQVFRIGHDVTTGQPDPHHYDLLASEARLASLVAIAKGDVPFRHWVHLRRPLGRVLGRRIALSWGGTMFEFLLPAVFMKTPERTLLGRTCQMVVRQQAVFGRAHRVPWGISEAAYGRRDAQGTYQYRAFGVPGTGLRRDLGDRLVIAPYATVLALVAAPRAAVDNLAAIEALGGLGRFGFFEAIDFGQTDRGAGPGVLVRSYMAHHQGMVLAAINNAVHGDLLVRRFHRDPRVASATPLLHERMTRGVPLQSNRRRVLQAFRPAGFLASAGWAVEVDHPVPQLHLLSNGRYSVLVGADGGSGSRWRKTALTRWRTDPSPDHWGMRFYLHDLDSDQLHVVGPDGGPSGSVRFAPHMAEFHHDRAGLQIQTRLTVAPRDDVELRVLSIRNYGHRPRRIGLTGYTEVALADPAEDRRHQAFTKLFVESEWVPELMTLLFRQRARQENQPIVHLGFGLVAEGFDRGSVSWDTDRAGFLGRAGDSRIPEAVARGWRLDGTVGATLDPVCALRCELLLPLDSTTEVAFVAAAGQTRADTLMLLNTYSSLARIDATFAEAAAQVDLELREVGMSEDELRTAETLFSAVVHPFHSLRRAAAAPKLLSRGQSALWVHAISGDQPLVALSVDATGDLPLVREVLRAHRYWRSRGARVDLVLIDEQMGGYDRPVRDAIQRAVSDLAGDLPPPEAGIFVVAAGQLAAEARAALECAARVFLVPDGCSLAGHLEPLGQGRPPLPEFVPMPSSPLTDEATPLLERPTDLEFDNGIGGFGDQGREYCIYHDRSQGPPRRWVNVVANPQFGFLVSERGDGFTWSGNSAENRLTPWRNDPLGSPPGEVLYLRDEETGEIWTPTLEPAGTTQPCLTRHGAGYTVFRHHAFGLEQELELFVHPTEPVKIARLRLRNCWRRPRRITATYFAEWVLGTVRDVTAPHVVVSYDAETEALFARCTFNETSGSRVAFLAASEPPHGFTADREEFLGDQARWRRPAGLERIGLSGSVQPGTDPCAALQVHLDIGPDQSVEVHFVIGQGADQDDARRLATTFRRPEAAQATWLAAQATWRELLDRAQVRTPDRATDIMLNHWLPYQILSCRMWGRTGLYQSSGAFGFRDQLQDALAFAGIAPELTRRQLLEAAGHQFEEGDVLHWWHPITERGVRTRCSDDLVWLPYAVAHYVETTGDIGVLDERVPFLRGPVLGPDEHQRFEHFETTAEPGTLLEHCLRALDRAWSLGSHRLPLIGGGDWNDGYDEVGRLGRGESVWLAWFLHATLTAFRPLCDRLGHSDRARGFADRAEQLREAVEQHGWDGQWYRRAFFDDGSPLGSADSAECQIDSTAQTWAVLSGAAAADRARQAMEAVWERLVRPDDRLVLLLTPLFDRSTPNPGYIRGYPPGVRENGAQYTHAAAWVGWAFAELGDGGRATEVFQFLNPIRHGDTPEAVSRYGGEPYVTAGDVLAAPPHVAAAGWTWYTGSAAWLYRLGVERILGIRRRGETLEIHPCLPPDWPGYQARYQVAGATYQIRVENPSPGGNRVVRVELDGRELADGRIPLGLDGSTHQVLVKLAGESAAASDPDS